MKVFKNLFGRGDKIHVDEIAVAPGLLLGGAVIVESGSNADGHYVRWGDGTQVCFAFMPELQGTTIGTAIGSLYRSGDITWTYPKPFSHFFYANGNTSGQSWVVTNTAVGRNNKNSMIFRLLRATEGVADRDVWFYAIGRWK